MGFVRSFSKSFSRSFTSHKSPKQVTSATSRAKSASANLSSKSKKRVHFADAVAAERHEYEFDWELEPEYWYSRPELKSFNEVRFDEAAALRKERGVRTASRNDADDLSSSKRFRFIGDKITNALDDVDDSHEISIRGIEHFVFPVLQKEMVGRKKALKKAVLGYSKDPKARRKDPQGIQLATESAGHSQWARDVATERGIKYCQMKRGGGRGGGLLSVTHGQKGRRRFSIDKLGSSERFSARLLSAK